MTDEYASSSSFTGNPLYGLFWIAEQIQSLVHPAEITLATLADPFNRDINEEYATQLRILQFVFFGLAVLVLIASVLFAIGRVVYNSCGGLESTKLSGYTPATLLTTRIFYYVFGAVLLAVVGLSLYANVVLFQGIGDTTALYASTLPPLTETQLAHMQQVVHSNAELFDHVQYGLKPNFTQIWNASLTPALTESVQAMAGNTSTNTIREPIAQLGASLSAVGVAIQEMRMQRAYMAAGVQGDAVMIAQQWQGTPYEALANETLAQLQGYYNFSSLDATMRELNVTLSSNVPPEQYYDAAQYLARSLPDQWTAENLVRAVDRYYAAVWSSFLQFLDTITFGVRRCVTGVATRQSVPNDGLGLVKFNYLMSMLNNILQYGIPVLYAMAGLVVLAVLGGTVAWSTQSYSVFYWMASFLVLGMVSSWSMIGFIMPASIITSDACNNGTFFNRSSVLEPDYFRSNYSALRVPTCASCQKDALFVSWEDFVQNAHALLDPTMDLRVALMAPLQREPQYVPGPMQVLQSLEQVETAFRSAELEEPSGKTPWEQSLATLRQTIPANETELLAQVDTLEQVGRNVTDLTQALYDSFQVLKQNLTDNVLPLIRILNETLQSNSAPLRTASDAAIQQMDTILRNHTQQFQEVYADLHVQCYSIANSTAVPQSVYADFETMLCGASLVGMDSTWFMQFVGFWALIPVTVLTLKAFKLISYAVLVDDDLLPAF